MCNKHRADDVETSSMLLDKKCVCVKISVLALLEAANHEAAFRT